MRKCLIVGLVFMSIHSFAQDTSSYHVQEIEGLTVLAEKRLPGSGASIDLAKNQQLNQTDINKILRLIPGVNIRDEEGFGLRPNIGLRGTSVNRSSKITLMEDGILTAPATYSDPSAYYFPTFARMDEVEVLKGSSQIKYGPYTIGGVVNLRSTKIPTDFKAFSQVSYGSFNTSQQRFWIGDNHNNLGFVFEGNRLASNGFKTLDNGGNTGFDRRDLMGKIRLKIGSSARWKQSISVKFLQATEDGNECYVGLTYQDYLESPIKRYAGTQKDNLKLSHTHFSVTHTISDFRMLTINTVAYQTKTIRDWGRISSIGGKNVNAIVGNPIENVNQYQILTGNEDGVISYQNAEREYYSLGLQSDIKLNFDFRKIKQSIESGIRIHKDQSDRYATGSNYQMLKGIMILASTEVKGNQENQLRDAISFATYLNYALTFRKVKIHAGLRYENISLALKDFGNADNGRLGKNAKSAFNSISVLAPGIGFDFEINPSNNLFGGVHKGFSVPGIPNVNATAVQANVESAINMELGFKHKTNQSNFQFVYFVSKYNNILGSDNLSAGGMGTGNMYNAGKADIMGIELSLSYDLLKNAKNDYIAKVPVSLAYTYTSALFKETFVNAGGDWGNALVNKGDEIPFITPHMLTFTIGYERKEIQFSVMCNFVGNTRVKPGQSGLIFPSAKHGLSDINAIGKYYTVDVSINYKKIKNTTLFSSIKNLTDNKAIVSNLPLGYRPLMPFCFIFGLKWEMK
ncbi:MAG: Iron(III) dicitrate transport protein FecA [Bacteroidota bacterium]